MSSFAKNLSALLKKKKYFVKKKMISYKITVYPYTQIPSKRINVCMYIAG